MKKFQVTYMICNRKYNVVLRGKDKKEISKFFKTYMIGSLLSIKEVI